MLAAFADILGARGLEFFLVHGTLLGWFRGRRMLPWDDDIDLSLSIGVLEELNRIRGEIRHPRFSLEVNPHFVERRTYNRNTFDGREPNKIDARFIDRDSGLFLDITALAPVASGVLATKCPHLYHVDEVFPLRRDSFEGIEVHVPRDPERLLHREYGPQCTTRTVFMGHCWWPGEQRWVAQSIALGLVPRPGG